jgi:glycerophosphoryl diester phosphodiesterase
LRVPAFLWNHRPVPPVFAVGAHRGASAVAVENSRAAFEAAIAAGADFIETDLRLSRDGVAVALHDPTLERLAGVPHAVADIDFAELRAMVPSLVRIEEAIDIVAERASLLIDTKIVDEGEVHRLAAELASRASGHRVAFGLRSLPAVAALRAVLPDCPVLGLFAGIADYPALKVLGGRWARLWQADVTAERVARLHDLGLAVVVMAGEPTPAGVGWITENALIEILRAEPDAVMVNDPRLAVALRDRRSPR